MTAPGGEEARDLIHQIKTIWEERSLLLKPDQDNRDAETEQRIKTDLLELVVVWADLRVRTTPESEITQSTREALEILDQAALHLGPSPALNRERQFYAQVLGLPRSPQNPESSPSSAWDYYHLGRFYLRSGLAQKAAAEFQQALELRPQDFWPNFYQGLTAYQLGKFEDATVAFRICIALAPTMAPCYYNRARAWDALGHPEQALSDYRRALNLDPTLAAAALNLGILSYKAGRIDDAITDFQQALHIKTDARTSGRVYYNLALAELARGDRPAALASVEEALARGYREAGDLRDRLRRGQ